MTYTGLHPLLLGTMVSEMGRVWRQEWARHFWRCAVHEYMCAYYRERDGEDWLKKGTA